MDLPKTFGELAIWSLMQFPVLAVTAAIAWWVNREAKRQYSSTLADLRDAHAGSWEHFSRGRIADSLAGSRQNWVVGRQRP